MRVFEVLEWYHWLVTFLLFVPNYLPMVRLVKEIGANGKNGIAIGTNGTYVTNQWYHWENPEHAQSCNI